MMETIIAVVVTLVLATGSIYIVKMKDKIHDVTYLIELLGRTLRYINEALEDDELSPEEVKQIVKYLEELADVAKKLIKGD